MCVYVCTVAADSHQIHHGNFLLVQARRVVWVQYSGHTYGFGWCGNQVWNPWIRTGIGDKEKIDVSAGSHHIYHGNFLLVPNRGRRRAHACTRKCLLACSCVHACSHARTRSNTKPPHPPAFSAQSHAPLYEDTPHNFKRVCLNMCWVEGAEKVRSASVLLCTTTICIQSALDCFVN